ncbi:hypothetical protein OOZ15_17535 [Galbibacter sp. EGI 63066]|uniref:hypothetical protein n=1 Tax=Galbibacter sp. EGI 63066 TaxID=2993559 RepID=UPI00224947F7|nr:hypothetical protein [Galbibacter sp. EGI 63066]MCX2681760.1 hypothetical protein [Galbibacter sp. EGI 63066]
MKINPLYIKILLYAFVLIMISCSCKSDSHKEKQAEQQVQNVVVKTKQNNNLPSNLNISFLLDLSDRIDPEKYPNPTMEYYQRDAGYIQAVSEAFTDHIRSKQLRLVNDKIQLFFDPEPLNPEINNISNQLKFAITRNNLSKELLSKINDMYTSQPEAIYKHAIADKNYVGSDTWRFFKDKIKDYCIQKNHRNILVVLTDGYIYHENSKMKEGNRTTYITPQTLKAYKLNTSKWKEKMQNEDLGFIPVNQNLEKIDILVLGINPNEGNPYEAYIIKEYWSSWLTEMNVKRFEIKNADLPSNLKTVIHEFILGQP